MTDIIFNTQVDSFFCVLMGSPLHSFPCISQSPCFSSVPFGWKPPSATICTGLQQLDSTSSIVILLLDRAQPSLAAVKVAETGSKCILLAQAFKVTGAYKIWTKCTKPSKDLIGNGEAVISASGRVAQNRSYAGNVS